MREEATPRHVRLEITFGVSKNIMYDFVRVMYTSGRASRRVRSFWFDWTLPSHIPTVQGIQVRSGRVPVTAGKRFTNPQPFVKQPVLVWHFLFYEDMQLLHPGWLTGWHSKSL